MKKIHPLFLLPLLVPVAAHAASVSLTAVADTVVFHRDGSFAYNNTNYGTESQLDTSQFGAGIWALSYIRFDLSAIPAGSTIDSAVFQVTKGATANIASFSVVRNDTITTGRFGSYGLLDVAGNTDQAWGETVLTGDGLGSELIQGNNPQFDSVTRTVDLNLATETLLSSATVVEVSGALVTQFIQNRLDATAGTGLATFIVDYMEDAGSGARGYSFLSREAGAGGPTLTVTYTVPEPHTALLGGLGLLALLRRRSRV